MEAAIMTAIWIGVFALAVWLALWLIGRSRLPETPKMIIETVIVVVALLILLYFLLTGRFLFPLRDARALLAPTSVVRWLMA